MTARPWEAPQHSYGPIIESFNYGQVKALHRALLADREPHRADRPRMGVRDQA
jgi:hypothetical protein